MTRYPIQLLLSVAEMQKAEQQAIKQGISGWQMMQVAGKGVAGLVMQYYDQRKVLVLCGPGNNGGDGYVAAQALHEAGWDVQVKALGGALEGDAATAQKNYKGAYFSEAIESVSDDTILIDALFGTGLTRAIDGEYRQIVEALAAKKLTVVAVDIPSGIHGDSGELMGAAIPAELTVTFGAKKRGHALYPGKEYCGRIFLVDIGIGEALESYKDIAVKENNPSLWLGKLPKPDALAHKYSRGSVLVRGGGRYQTGASRLAAIAALRAGAGAVTVAASHEAADIYAHHLTAIMLSPYANRQELARLFAEKRYGTLLIGPANGVDEDTQAAVLSAAATGKKLVLDADALTVFTGRASDLIQKLPAETVLTPHEGEFSKLFGVALEATAKIERAEAAARMLGVVIVLKGTDTVIAAPDGRVAVNANAPATLATAGSGDVLSGIIAGLMAQGMSAFDAACAGVWLHAEAAGFVGRGLIAEDLPNLLPPVFDRLLIDEE